MMNKEPNINIINNNWLVKNLILIEKYSKIGSFLNV